MYTFPTAIDNPQRIIDLLGSYWPGTYGGDDLVIAYGQGCNQAEQQLNSDMFELAASVGMYACPVLNRRLWYNLTLKQSELGVGNTFPIPSNFREAHYGANRIVTPTVMYTQGIDFILDSMNNLINFTTNPFMQPGNTPIPVVVNNVVVDYLLPLWFLNAGIDNDWLYAQFGYVIPLRLSSSEIYKKAIVAVLGSYASGTDYNNIGLLLEAIADAPRVLTDGETVKVLSADAVHRLVITDKNSYAFGLGATPSVTVGQVVNKGDQLVDAVAIYEPSQGTAPPIASVTIGAGLLDPSIAGPLTFSNGSTPLIVTLNVFGFTKVEWALGGAGPDVTSFFSLLHSKGVANGATLANYMDNRPQPQPTQPTAVNLPATINPMLFLYQNAFRANAFTIVLKPTSFGPEALGTSLLYLLRNIIPPHNTAIIVTI
jgi:hypothetical protein